MSDPKRVRRAGCSVIREAGINHSVKWIETFADDPADWDALLSVAIKLIRAASIGDQYFIPALMGNDPETTKVRHLLVDLGEALRWDDNKPRSEK